jgi:hypothetical protein
VLLLDSSIVSRFIAQRQKILTKAKDNSSLNVIDNMHDQKTWLKDINREIEFGYQNKMALEQLLANAANFTTSTHNIRFC